VTSGSRPDIREATWPTLVERHEVRSAQAAVKIAPQARLKVYPGAPHGLCSTHKDEVNADLLEFLK
jgi:non-heme chloroperoxidase